jgi:hypothetical protein
MREFGMAVVDNLNHNYSPHLEPSVETASSTVQLRSELLDTAKDCLLSYLLKWRITRRESQGPGGESGVAGRRTNDSRKVDIVRLLSLSPSLYRSQ